MQYLNYLSGKKNRLYIILFSIHLVIWYLYLLYYPQNLPFFRKLNFNSKINKISCLLIKPFNSKNDTIILIHIQKTAGTYLENKITRQTVLQNPCHCIRRKKLNCICPRVNLSFHDINDVKKNSEKIVDNWLFSRSTYSWSTCGLHATYTDLKECIPKKLKNAHRYLYITIIREPFMRFLSEYLHVKRGATWNNSKHQCMHKLHKIPQCLYVNKPNIEGKWSAPTLKEFISCPYNLALNRQTIHLASLDQHNCYSFLNAQVMNLTQNYSGTTIHESQPQLLKSILASAKYNLQHKLAFFALTEYMGESEYLAEKMLGLRFRKRFSSPNQTFISRNPNGGYSFQPKLRILTNRRKIEKMGGQRLIKDPELNLTSELANNILEANWMDVELYAFAKQLFMKRLADYQKDGPYLLKIISYS